MGMARTILVLAATAALVWPVQAPAAAPVEAEAAGYAQALDAATRDLCGKQVALLGENGFHGDGKTVAFKAALIERLVTRCGYNAVYFEASHYDFLDIARRQTAGHGVKADEVSSAIGWLWNHDAEMQPLIGFLAKQANAGRITLGGLDDQLGGRDEFYSLDRMPTELAGYLPEVRRADCQARLHQRIYYAYPQTSPHTPEDLAPLKACIEEIRTAVLARAPSLGRDEVLQLVANVERCLERDFVRGPDYVVGRDRSMAANLRWLAAHGRPDQKIIVWAATAHIARQGAEGENTLGTEVAKDYGPRAFMLGFSAGGGSYRYSSKKNVEIPPAPPGSMEARALEHAKGEAGYLGPKDLARLGTVSGAAFDHANSVARDWSKLIDGLVVFRAARPPHRTDG